MNNINFLSHLLIIKEFKFNKKGFPKNKIKNFLTIAKGN